MIKIDFDIHNTGNQIIQFLFGYSLSQRKNMNLIFKPITGFSKLQNINHRQNKDYNYIATRSFGDQNVNYDVLLNHNGGVLINSYLQRLDFYLEKNIFKSLIKPDEETDVILSQDDIVIHVRMGDYFSGGINIPFIVYDNFIKENIGLYDRFIILTDDINSDIVKTLLNNSKTELVHQSKFKDFDLLRKAKNTFISQSSFSWLATYFGESEIIYVPIPESDNVNCMWKKNPKHDDIFLVDENKDRRYKKIFYNRP
jgi:hypothetical protein